MITYIYDGSFDGLLSCIYKAFYSKEKPETPFKMRSPIPLRK